MTSRNIKSTLRAFNNDCEAAIASCRWTNVNAMENAALGSRDHQTKMSNSGRNSAAIPRL
ncbi:DUF4041 domain-containing protein [Sinorhizobium psoraleae]|uniref:DUF4041 domain-containing protein n=1 Tax=Sinorhizobium psoraleae TaxID=520838 RepID=A0ABT4KMF4_9HYPH|nr:DUF4041 domain-containing protein [Sinorhizobium psoraleae]MCZ4093140.1 DUF4041 domain-containing protein [Sinorhizobium psoraleae]